MLLLPAEQTRKAWKPPKNNAFSEIGARLMQSTFFSVPKG
jgi:hypothetical protein